MKALDRVFGCLMILGGMGHAMGSYRAYSNQPMALLWALSASFAVFLLAAINLLRAGRRGDGTLAWISLGGCVGQMGFALWFGLLIGNVFDFRPMGNLIITLALAMFSLRSALAPRA
jgi:hypothetical protein